jgi:hypothetical protein
MFTNKNVKEHKVLVQLEKRNTIDQRRNWIKEHKNNTQQRCSFSKKKQDTEALRQSKAGWTLKLIKPEMKTYCRNINDH